MRVPADRQPAGLGTVFRGRHRARVVGAAVPEDRLVHDDIGGLRKVPHKQGPPYGAKHRAGDGSRARVVLERRVAVCLQGRMRGLATAHVERPVWSPTAARTETTEHPTT